MASQRDNGIGNYGRLDGQVLRIAGRIGEPLDFNIPEKVGIFVS